MRSLMRHLMTSACAAALLLSAGAALAQAPAGAVIAQAPAGASAPAGFVAPAEPKPDENNAQRGKTQPGNNAPFWRAVRESGSQAGYTSLPGPEKGQLIQSMVQYPGSRLTTAGEAWRQVRNQFIIPYGGALLLIVLLALAIFYWRRGPLGAHQPDTGRLIERFTPFERAAHWSNAIAFSVLAISGIVMAFGKFFLLPIIGGALFGWLTYALKTVHNIVGPLFVVSLLIVIITFIRDNLPTGDDLTWLKRGGGLFGGGEPPSHRFNAGEKLIFWGGVLVLGLVVALSGLALDFLLPGIEFTRQQMQIANMIHGVAAMLMMAAFLGHIYMGTIGMRGAYQAMRHGYVDEAWAQDHHALWAEDIRAGRIPARRSADTPPAASSPPRPHQA